MKEATFTDPCLLHIQTTLQFANGICGQENNIWSVMLGTCVVSHVLKCKKDAVNS